MYFCFLTFVFVYLLQFDGFIDLDAYNTIALKLKGNCRCYIYTVRYVALTLQTKYRFELTEFSTSVARFIQKIGLIHLDSKKIILGRLLYMYLQAIGILLRHV